MIAVSLIRLQNAPHMSLIPTRRATVATIVIAAGDADVSDTVSAIGRQVYESATPVVVGHDANASPAFASVNDAVAAFEPSADYIWIVRGGALPHPDTLTSLVADAERTGAGIIGSKVVTDDDALISVGLVTDVFGVPYTGLDLAERDQGQYDVVRDVAAVAGVSMLVRRDLLHGLGGVDPELAPLAASVDLAHRARLKGARVMISPASEITFNGDVAGPVRWREEASRIQSNLKIYGLLTLLWVLPLNFIVDMIEVVVSIFFGRWFGWDFVKARAWNVAQLPKTAEARRRARHQRVVGDSELFRFQRRGSVKLTGLATGIMAAVRKRLPGDDTLSVESIGRDMRQPSFVVGLLAVVFVGLASRNIWADGLPAVGYSLPFPTDGWQALTSYAGGWNPAGLGSDVILRPLVAVTGFLQMVTFDSGRFAEYAMTAGAMLLGIWGTVRLLRTWSIGAAAGTIAGVIYIAGPTAQGIAGNTYVGTLFALGVLPWALRMCLAPIGRGVRPMIGRLCSVGLTFGILGALAPLLLLAPAAAILVYAIFRFNEERAWRAVILALAGTAIGGLLLSPWIWDHSLDAIARAGYAYWGVSPVLAVAGAVLGGAAVLAAERPLGIVAGWGAALAGLGFFVSRAGSFGLGTEAEVAGLAIAGLGLAVTVGVVSETLTSDAPARWRRAVAGVGAVAIVFFVVSASVILLGGRAGLPGDQIGETLAFTMANEGEAERSRVLLVGPADLMPGDSRSISGGAYRVVSAPVPDLGEARLAGRRALDEDLFQALDEIITGETRRAGDELAPFGVRWIVVLGDSDGADADESSVAWRDVFAGQLDLLPLSAGVESAVFVSDVEPVGRALTLDASWPRIGWRYQGDPQPGASVFVADNPNPRFGPGPWRETASANEVSANAGVVTYDNDGTARGQALGVLAGIVVLAGGAWWGRRES